MDISEKIKKIREKNNLTQEEFAKMLFVSRTAVSKWELKKGYPSIDSLKLISQKFNISLDELLTNSEVVDIAENDIKDKKKKITNLMIAIIDLFPLVFLFVPFFAKQSDGKIVYLPLFSWEILSTIKLVLFLIVICLSFVMAVLEFISIKLDNKRYDKIIAYCSFAISIIGISLFVECKQIYASIFMLGLLVAKGFLTIKNK